MCVAGPQGITAIFQTLEVLIQGWMVHGAILLVQHQVLLRDVCDIGSALAHGEEVIEGLFFMRTDL